MTSYSQGVAIWIGFNLHEARMKYSQQQLDEMIGESDISETISRMLASGSKVYYCFQYPGESSNNHLAISHLFVVMLLMCLIFWGGNVGCAVQSGLGDGSSHLVVTLGPLVEQLAWNKSMCPEGVARSLCFWQGSKRDRGNSAILTRHVLPCLTLQSQGYQLGLTEELRQLVKGAQHIAEADSRAIVEWFDHDANSPKIHGYCDSCMKMVEVTSVNRNCICRYK